MNDKDLESYLRENLKLNRENNVLLKKIDSRQKWSRNWTIIYWVLIIGAAAIGYYYASPYFASIGQEFSGVFSEISTLAHFNNQTPAKTSQ